MRNVIALYRYLIAALFLGVSAGLFYFLGLAVAALAGPPGAAATGIGLVGSIAIFVALLLFVGITATIVSIHDKVVELVDAVLKGR